MKVRYWLLLLFIPLPVMAGFFFFQTDDNVTVASAWEHVDLNPPHVDHSPLISGPLESGRAATAVCLDCHEEQGDEMLHNVHYTWLSEPVEIPGREEPVAIGKRNLINNFCSGTQSNEASCSKCHAGYGFVDQKFDFLAL